MGSNQSALVVDMDMVGRGSYVHVPVGEGVRYGVQVPFMLHVVAFVDPDTVAPLAIGIGLVVQARRIGLRTTARCGQSTSSWSTRYLHVQQRVNQRWQRLSKNV